jgi:hypothetical protein
MTSVKLYAECFAPHDIHDHFAVTPCVHLWQQWMESNPQAERLFLRIYAPGRMDDEETFLVPVGDPVRAEGETNALYLPTWMIDANKYSGSGEETLIEVLEASSLPKATKITVRPVDSALHEVDVVSLFERCFSRLGVLQEGKMYLIPLDELGDFPVAVFISKLEPAEEVYLDGDDVPLDFEQAVDHVEPPPRVPTPVPPAPAMLAPMAPAEEEDLMVPRNMFGGGGGSGSAVRPQARPRGGVPPGFVPFSGPGRRLDGK